MCVLCVCVCVRPCVLFPVHLFTVYHFPPAVLHFSLNTHALRTPSTARAPPKHATLQCVFSCSMSTLQCLFSYLQHRAFLGKAVQVRRPAQRDREILLHPRRVEVILHHRGDAHLRMAPS